MRRMGSVTVSGLPQLHIGGTAMSTLTRMTRPGETIALQVD